MEIDILEFIEQCRDLFKLAKALGRVHSLDAHRASLFRVEDSHSYPETPNRLKYMAEVRTALDIDRDDLPDYTT
ncbi:ISH9-type transposase [Natronorubrum sulfidifaciens JCM 14089]|uniref:ISH9-type transposase n=1 Tax=Natronorubrum sulfidifaciens JCM 14089 TaxID=1230460 RepID=L9WG38_9EURY|nr:ISH9-type transposase [Natronorubrum sulfidifaciens JCM 14089]